VQTRKRLISNVVGPEVFRQSVTVRSTRTVNYGQAIAALEQGAARVARFGQLRHTVPNSESEQSPLGVAL